MRATVALARFALACTWRSWRWLPAYVITVTVLALLYMVPSGAALPAFATTTVLVVPMAAWLVAAAGNADDEPHQRLLAAGTSVARVHASRALAGAVLAAPLVVLAVAWPMVLRQVTWREHAHGLLRALVGGLAAHLVGAAIGVAIGSFAHRPVLRRTGGAAIAAVLGTLAVTVSPPGIRFLRALGHDRFVAVVWALPVAAVAVVGAVTVAGRLAVRSR